MLVHGLVMLATGLNSTHQHNGRGNPHNGIQEGNEEDDAQSAEGDFTDQWQPAMGAFSALNQDFGAPFLLGGGCCGCRGFGVGGGGGSGYYWGWRGGVWMHCGGREDGIEDGEETGGY